VQGARRIHRVAVATLLVALSPPGNPRERAWHPATIGRSRPEAPTVAPRPLRAVTVSLDTPPSTAPPCADPRGIPLGVHACHLLAAGTIDSSWAQAARASCLALLATLNRNVVSDPSGGAFVGWVDARLGEPSIYLQRLTATATTAPGWPPGGVRVCPSEQAQYQLDIIADGAGGTYLAWQDYRSRRLGQVILQHLAVDGSPASGWPARGLAIDEGRGDNLSPVAARDSLGRPGAVVGGWPAGGAPVAIGAHNQFAPCLSGDGAGGTIVTWADPPSGLRVAAASLARAGSHSLPTLRESHAMPGRARLIWTGAAAFVESLDVERRVTGAAWSFLVRLAPDDSRRVVVEDSHAPPGATQRICPSRESGVGNDVIHCGRPWRCAGARRHSVP